MVCRPEWCIFYLLKVYLLNDTDSKRGIHLEASLKNLVGIFPDQLFVNLAIV